MFSPSIRLFIHVAWGRWDRLSQLTPAGVSALQECMKEECERHGAHMLAAGAIEDFVHVLARMPDSISIDSLVGFLQQASSSLIRQTLLKEGRFEWDGDYVALSVSEESIPAIESYILFGGEHPDEETLQSLIGEYRAELR